MVPDSEDEIPETLDPTSMVPDSEEEVPDTLDATAAPAPKDKADPVDEEVPETPEEVPESPVLAPARRTSLRRQGKADEKKADRPASPLMSSMLFAEDETPPLREDKGKGKASPPAASRGRSTRRT